MHLGIVSFPEICYLELQAFPVRWGQNWMDHTQAPESLGYSSSNLRETTNKFVQYQE